MGGVHRVLASSLNDALIDERRKESRGGMRGEERADESVRRPEEDQSPVTGKTDGKKNPPGDHFVS